LKTALCALAFLALVLAAPVAASAQTISTITTLLPTPSGEQTSVAKLGEGKVTVVSFWATWCKPCKEEMKAMQPLFEKLKGNGLQYIAISVDNTKTMEKVGPYISAKGYTFPVLIDANSDLFHKLNGTEVPYTLIFNADGSLHSKHEGYLEGDESKMESELTALLAKSSSVAPSGTTEQK
jgi:peroxiredoxin